MLTQTSELAIKSLIFLALEGGKKPLSPRQVARSLGCSPSYLAKTFSMLVKAGILHSVRGAHGGVLLTTDPAEITLLEVVEAAQGLLIGDYCQQIGSHGENVCSFHETMKELHRSTVNILSRCTLKDLLICPAVPNPSENAVVPCKMYFKGWQGYSDGSDGTGGVVQLGE